LFFRPHRDVDIPAYEHVVEVITDPAGARIVVNDDYVGDSPVTIRLLAYQTPSGNIQLTGRYVVERYLPPQASIRSVVY